MEFREVVPKPGPASPSVKSGEVWHFPRNCSRSLFGWILAVFHDLQFGGAVHCIKAAAAAAGSAGVDFPSVDNQSAERESEGAKHPYCVLELSCCTMRRSISFLLIATAVTLLVVFVSGGLWGLLAATRDRAAASGAKGVAFVAAACWGLSFVSLVIVLAVAYLRTDDDSRKK